MFLVVSQDHDDEAVWLARCLRELGLDPLELVTAGELSSAARWEHRIDRSGTRTIVRLADGRTLDSNEVGAVLNRLSWLWPVIGGASEADVAYAAEELRALALSWLASLGDAVLGRPAPPGLSPPQRAPWQWRWIASDAGLPIAPYRTGEPEPEPVASAEPERALLVIDGEAVGEGWTAPDPERLAAALGLDVFSARFVAGGDGEDGWALAAVDPLPALAGAGDAALDAIAAAMRRRVGVPA